jgi:hypothetical protein
MLVLQLGGGIRQHTSAYVSIRQHTSAYVSIRQQKSSMASTVLVLQRALFCELADVC